MKNVLARNIESLLVQLLLLPLLLLLLLPAWQLSCRILQAFHVFIPPTGERHLQLHWCQHRALLCIPFLST